MGARPCAGVGVLALRQSNWLCPPRESYDMHMHGQGNHARATAPFWLAAFLAASKGSSELSYEATITSYACSSHKAHALTRSEHVRL